jgi:hypothetical protein
MKERSSESVSQVKLAAKAREEPRRDTRGHEGEKRRSEETEKRRNEEGKDRKKGQEKKLLESGNTSAKLCAPLKSFSFALYLPLLSHSCL